MNYDHLSHNAQMFSILVAKIKAGYIGQVTIGDKIIWESDPVSSGNQDEDIKLAISQARDKVASVMEKLFLG